MNILSIIFSKNLMSKNLQIEGCKLFILFFLIHQMNYANESTQSSMLEHNLLGVLNIGYIFLSNNIEGGSKAQEGLRVLG